MAVADIARMVRRQIASRGVGDARVLAAMRKVERADFLPAAMREFAYEDSALPLDQGQTVSQPYIVARMAEVAEVAPADRVLEVGAGSGYAAAVFAELAAHVYTIERHDALAQYARSRLQALHYDNVEVRTGDGTLGWPEAAPFDAVIVSAGGPRVPLALRDQLAVGGRLVMPVGIAADRQQLVRLRRTSPREFVEEWLDEVRFVPLIGAEGWTAEAPSAPYPSDTRPSGTGLPHMIAAAAHRLPEPEEAAFADLFERFADRRVVLLGEASHGTSEFYRARAAITRRLIERHGFDIVAVEADWPDAAAIDRYARHRGEPAEVRPAFRRFPSWMWRNREVDAFVRWLSEHNGRLGEAGRAGFYGLDIYSLSDRTRTLRLPHAMATGSGLLRPGGAEPALPRMRGRRGGGAHRPVVEAAGAGRRGRSPVRRRAECRAGGGGRALLPHHVLRRRGELEPARPPHVRYAAAPARPSRRAIEGGGVGAQFPYRRCAPHRHGPRARRAQSRPAVPRALRRPGGGDRLRHPSRHRRRRA